MHLLVNKDWSTLKKLLFEFLARGGGQKLTLKTATGNPATFETNIERVIQSFRIPFTFVQEGSGTPGLDNVRPITGLTGLTISASGEDTDDPDTYAVSFGTEAGTVYGGTVDAAKGILTIDTAFDTFDETRSWSKGTNSGGYARYYRYMPQMAYGADRQDILGCNWMNPAPNGATAQAATPPETITANRPSAQIYLKTSVADTVDEFKEYLKDHPLQVVYRLANPIVYKINTVPIRTLIGENNVWTDTGSDNTIKYLYQETS